MEKIKLISAIFVSDGKILAEIRKSTDDFGAGATWIPGGHVEAGETNEAAFLREVDEELAVKPLEYYPLCELDWEKEHRDYIIEFFVCTKWSGEMVAKEAERLAWIGTNELERLDENVDRKAVQRYLGMSRR